MNNRTILCTDHTGIVYRVINNVDRGTNGWAYEVQSPSGERSIIEPSHTDGFTILPNMFSLELGQIVSTPGALEALERNGQTPAVFLSRHQIGDWGVLDREDQQANELALKDGSRLLSLYLLNDGTRIYVMTDAVGDDGKRASTCVLLPDEY